jgi:hypothetical protein
LQKKFQVRETIPLSALAFGRSHALVAEGFNNKGWSRSAAAKQDCSFGPLAIPTPEPHIACAALIPLALGG